MERFRLGIGLCSSSFWIFPAEKGAQCKLMNQFFSEMLRGFKLISGHSASFVEEMEVSMKSFYSSFSHHHMYLGVPEYQRLMQVKRPI